MSHVKARGTAQNPPRPPFRPRNAFLAGAAMLLASLLITTEALVAEKPKKETAPAMPAGGMDY